MMSKTFQAACVQMSSGPDVGPNLDVAEALIRQAASAGAEFILTPENTSMIEPDRKQALEKSPAPGDHLGIARFSALARELKAWLLIGSMPVRVEPARIANRSFLFGPDGGLVQWYDKIHMFDVDLPNGETYRESRNVRPGERAAIAALPWGTLGLTICYDVRFAYLYRALAKAGADFLSVPAAFTVPTGQAHWHVLLRARAIETGCFVLAPAQCGTHARNRQTYGHSLVVAPWGEIIAEGGESPGVILAEIDPAKVKAARAMVPALRHDRPFAPPTSAGADGNDSDTILSDQRAFASSRTPMRAAGE